MSSIERVLRVCFSSIEMVCFSSIEMVCRVCYSSMGE